MHLTNRRELRCKVSLGSLRKKMQKLSFIASVKIWGMLQLGYVKSNDNAAPYLDGKTLESLIFPSRVADHSKTGQWLRLAMGDFSLSQWGRSLFSQARFCSSTWHLLIGSKKPKPNTEGEYSINVEKDTMYLMGTKGVLMNTVIWLTTFDNTKPLLDKTHTPRGRWKK